MDDLEAAGAGEQWNPEQLSAHVQRILWRHGNAHPRHFVSPRLFHDIGWKLAASEDGQLRRVIEGGQRCEQTERVAANPARLLTEKHSVDADSQPHARVRR
jgi:hypothetical protein